MYEELMWVAVWRGAIITRRVQEKFTTFDIGWSSERDRAIARNFTRLDLYADVTYMCMLIL